MFFILSKVFAFLIQPIIWVFILLLLSTFIKKKRKKLLFYSIITFWFFSNAFICDEVSRIWEYKAVGIENIKGHFDVGIVLGGISEYDFKHKMLNFNNSSDRLIFAEQLYRKGAIKKILISGGSGRLINNDYVETTAIKAHLINNGITKNNIIIEENSRNTKENVFYTANILNQEFKSGRFLLITSANHMKRSLLCFKKAGVKVIPFPVGNTNPDRKFQLDYLLLPDSETFERWEDLIHEWVGYVVYRATF